VNQLTSDSSVEQELLSIVHIILNVCIKYEVSVFNHSEDIKGSQNFEIGHVT